MPRPVLATAPVVAALVVAFALAPTARAADAEGRFAIKGIGRAPCEAYLSARKERSNYYYMFGGWIEGYLTGLNQATPDTFDIASFESTELLAALVDTNCRNNPGATFFDVVSGIAAIIKDQRLTTEAPLVEIQVGDKTARLYKTTIERVQTRLKETGYYQGAVDGAFGPETQHALEAFQRDNKIDATGFPDQLTLNLLLRPKREG